MAQTAEVVPNTDKPDYPGVPVTDIDPTNPAYPDAPKRDIGVALGSVVDPTMKGGPSSLPFGPGGAQDFQAISDVLREAGEAKATADQKSSKTTLDSLNRTRRDVEGFRNAEVYAAGNMPAPWDAQKESDKTTTPFLEKFGSAAMVAAMIGSAFSKQPLTTALAAGGAAMEAVNRSDTEGYKRAYDAWKENTQLAIKRFDMEHQLFNDTKSLFDLDITKWTTENQINAAKYKDDVMLGLLRAGKAPEAFELMEKRAQNFENMQKAIEGGDRHNERVDSWQAMNNEIKEKHGRFSDDPWGQTKLDKAKDLWGLMQQSMALKGPGPETNVLHDALQHFVDTGEYPTNLAAQLAAAQSRYGSGAGGNTALTGERSINAEVEQHKKEYKAAHPDATNDEVSKEGEKFRNELRRTGTPLTAHDRATQQAHITQFDNAMSTIDSVLNVLQTHAGAAGLAGKVMRLGERLGNIAGIPDAERVQMMREVEQLRLTAPELLLDRQGRPLSAEAGRINDIVAGTSAGDTGPNTILALQKLKDLYAKKRGQAFERLNQGDIPASPASAPTDSEPSGRFWDQDK